MTPRSGIALFTVIPFGKFRMDDSGITLVDAQGADHRTVRQINAIAAAVWTKLDGQHIAVSEASIRLHEAFNVPAEDIVGLTITEVEVTPEPPEGAVF